MQCNGATGKQFTIITNMTKTTKEKDHELDMVQRKLTDVFIVVPTEISWSVYSQYVSYMHEHLFEIGVNLDINIMMRNQAVVKRFERTCIKAMEIVSDDTDVLLDDSVADAEQLFVVEIREHRERERLKELEAAATKLEERKRFVQDSVSIKVSKDKFKMANDILRAAGIIS